MPLQKTAPVAAVYLGTESSGTYTFNRETNTVTVMIDGLSNDMSFSGDTLTWKSWEFTREQVQQLTEENMYEAVLGNGLIRWEWREQ